MGKIFGGKWLIAAFVVTLGLSLSHSSGAFAASKIWTGTAGDHKFSTAGNWSPSGAPTTGDSLTFPNTVTDNKPDNDITGLVVAGITLNGAGTNTITVSGNAMTNSGDITVGQAGTNTYPTISAPLTLSAAQTINTIGDSEFTLSGVIDGSGAITKTGTGILRLTAANPSYTGAISSTAGTFQTWTATSLGATSAGTTIAAGSTLGVCYSNGVTIAEPLTIGSTGNGGAYSTGIVLGSCAQMGGGGNGTVTVHTATWSGPITLTANTTLGGAARILKVTGPLSGAYTLTIPAGSDSTLGLEIASSANTSGTPNGTVAAESKTTTITDSQPGVSVYIGSNNTYIINGVRGDTTVSDGGILKGTGTLGNLTVYLSGIVAPGTSPGCLTVGNLDIQDGIYQAEIGGTAACTGYDQIKVTGTVLLTSATSVLTPSIVNSFKPTAGQTFTLIENDGTDAVSGTFKGLAEGATVTIGSYVFRISYVGGTGNDVVLTTVTGVKVPNTGVQFVTGNPVLVAGAGLVAGLVLLGLARSRSHGRR